MGKADMANKLKNMAREAQKNSAPKKLGDAKREVVKKVDGSNDGKASGRKD